MANVFVGTWNFVKKAAAPIPQVNNWWNLALLLVALIVPWLIPWWRHAGTTTHWLTAVAGVALLLLIAGARGEKALCDRDVVRLELVVPPAEQLPEPGLVMLTLRLTNWGPTGQFAARVRSVLRGPYPGYGNFYMAWSGRPDERREILHGESEHLSLALVHWESERWMRFGTPLPEGPGWGSRFIPPVDHPVEFDLSVNDVGRERGTLYRVEVDCDPSSHPVARIVSQSPLPG